MLRKEIIVRTERQQELLNAAVNIVAKEGFSRLTIRKVAAAVGVTEPAVYRHFPHKLALLTAILEDLQSAVIPHFQKLAVADGTPEQLVSGFIDGLFSELTNKPAFAPLVFSEEAFHSEPQLRPMLLSMMRENLAILGSSFARLQSRGLFRKDIGHEKMALITMGTIRLTVTRSMLTGRAERLSDQAVDLADTFVHLFSVKEYVVS
jgi:AcrR family transcriptional regulator